MTTTIKRAVMGAVLFCASQAVAQTDTLVGIRKGSVELGVAGGLSAPIGDYADLASLSGTGAIIVGYYLSPRFSLGIDAGGHWHGPTDQADSILTAQLGQPASDLSLKLYRIFTPYARYQFKVAKVSPYVTGLAGFYLQEVKWTQTVVGGTITQTVAQGYIGVAAGFGVQFVSDDNVVISLESRFHNALRSGATPLQFVDLRLGFTFLL